MKKRGGGWQHIQVKKKKKHHLRIKAQIGGVEQSVLTSVKRDKHPPPLTP
jgi:hypothetical protein